MSVNNGPIYNSLAGTECVCGNKKNSRQSFCRSCFYKLPRQTRMALYLPVDYPETFVKACDTLGLEAPTLIV